MSKQQFKVVRYARRSETFEVFPVVAALEATPELVDGTGVAQGNPVLQIRETYRNDPIQIPGRKVWLCLAVHSGRLMAESEESLEDCIGRARLAIQRNGGILS